MQGKTDKWERRRHEDQGGPFWRRSSRLPARRLGFPTTCCLVLNKPLACSLETPYTMAERVPYQELFTVPTFWPSLCPFNPLVPFSLWDLSFCLAQCRWHVWPANNELLTAMSWSLTRMQISNWENMKEWTLQICWENTSAIAIQYSWAKLKQMFCLLYMRKLLTLLPFVPLCVRTQGQLKTTHWKVPWIFLILNTKDIFLILYRNHFTGKRSGHSYRPH